ncbi:MAG TPA: MraY family glycosyltransferase [Anaerolineales bacterium]|nr:MraY family glycosyltransferase [Anaerolineales bacterium]
MVFQIVLTTVLALVFSFVIAPLSISLAWRFHLIDDPGLAARKIHKAPMPRAGGTIIFLAILSGGALSGVLTTRPFTSIILALMIVFAFGIWDDIHNIRAIWKLLGQILATLILIWQGVVVLFPGNTALNIAITLFWVIGITNAFNLVDSMDGLAVGLAGITVSFLMIGALYAGQNTLALFCAILLGASISVFHLNFSLSRLFLGDSGTQLLGFTLAAIAIVYTPPHLPQASSWFVPILLFGIPIFDTTLVTFSRMRKKMPVYKGNRDHTFHRLVDLGATPHRAVLSIHMVAILLDCLAFFALSLSPLWANITFGVILLSGLFAILWLEANQKVETL